MKLYGLCAGAALGLVFGTIVGSSILSQAQQLPPLPPGAGDGMLFMQLQQQQQELQRLQDQLQNDEENGVKCR